ncbi:MAG: T9SS type A sorting domain-containing protein [Bacteroidota bacterium]
MIKTITIVVGAAAFILSFLLTIQLRQSIRTIIGSESVRDNSKLEARGILDAVRWYQRVRAYPATTLPEGWREKAFRHIQKNNLAKSPSVSSVSWRAAGPNNVGGRTRAIVIDPVNDSLIYAAGVSGGIWKSTDAANTWTPISDFTQDLIVSCLAVDPINSNIIYAGTGEGYFNIDALIGTGILKSTDAGATWTLYNSFSPAPYYKYYINKIIVRPDQPHTLYAALVGGVFRSIDSGVSWNLLNVGSRSSFCMDLIEDPNSPGTLYAAFGFDLLPITHDGIYKTIDGGNTWTKSATGFPAAGYGRISLGIGTSNSQVLYACLSDSATSNTYGIEKTTDGGAHWSAVANPHHMGTQGWYGNVITVDPTDPNIVYTGGIDLYKSVNGGATWGQITRGSSNPLDVHVDQHAIVITPDNPSTIFFGNDGGVFRSTNSGGAFTAQNTNYVTTQFYGCSIHPLNDIRIGGTQDNGTLKTNTNTKGIPIFGGDGGYTAIDFNIPTTYYTEYTYLSIFKSSSSGDPNTWNQVVTNIPMQSNPIYGTSDRCAFIAPYVMDPSNSSVLVAGTFKIYRTINGAASWAPLTGDITGDGDGSGQVGSFASVISAIAIAPKNSSFVCVGTSGSQPPGATPRVIVTTNLFGNYTNVTKSPLPNRVVSTLAVDNANNIFAGFQGYNGNTPGFAGHVFMSTNTGGSWSNISGDLPDIPVNKLLLDPDNSNHILAATDLGVFETLNGGTNWLTTSAPGGMPNVPVFDLSLRKFDHVVLAGTHGRGMYQSNGPLGVVEVSHAIPQSYSLGQNYPNPFNPATTIPFSIANRANVRLTVYNSLGQEVATIVNREFTPGSYIATFNATNIASGIYYYRLIAGSNINEMKKMVLIK